MSAQLCGVYIRMSQNKIEEPLSEDEFDDSFLETDEDDDLEDLEEIETPGAKRRKPAHGGFIFDEAEVGDEDEEEEEYEEGYEELVREQKAKQERSKYEEKRQRKFTDLGDEKQLEKLVAKYENKPIYDENDEIEPVHAIKAERQELLPGINDPYLWIVKCSVGEERKLAFLLMRKALKCVANRTPLSIKSVIQLDRLKGYIYIEAYKSNHIKHAIEDVYGLKQGINNHKVIPTEEMSDVLQVYKHINGIVVNGWVRFKRGIYKDDICQIMSYDPIKCIVNLRLVPRLDYRKLADRNFKLKKFSRFRPVAVLFDDEKARNAGLELSSEGNYIVCKNMRFKQGFLYKRCHVSNVTAENVTPTLKELEVFNMTLNDSEVGKIVKNKSEIHINIGDVVKVVEGELKDVIGVVLRIFEDVITLKPRHEELEEAVEVGKHEVIKYFKQGDLVKVINGEYKNNSGIVVRVEENKVYVLSCNDFKEMILFSNDVQLSSEKCQTFTENCQFILHDFVQIDPHTTGVVTFIQQDCVKVLDQYNKVRKIEPQSLKKKSSNFGIFYDKNRNVIRPGETVRITDGVYRGLCGKFLCFFKNIVFINSPQIRENSNIYACPSKYISTLQPFGQSVLFTKNDEHIKRQISRSLNKEKSLIGSTVRIVKGAYKGHIGIVKSEKDNSLGIELHARNKIILLDKEFVGVYDKNMTTVSKITTTCPKEENNSNYKRRTPNNDSSKTPRYGSMTPAQDSSLRSGLQAGLWDINTSKSLLSDYSSNINNNAIDYVDDFDFDLPKPKNKPNIVKNMQNDEYDPSNIVSSNSSYLFESSSAYNNQNQAGRSNSSMDILESNCCSIPINMLRRGTEVIINMNHPSTDIAGRYAVIISVEKGNLISLKMLNINREVDERCEFITLDVKHMSLAEPRINSEVRILYRDLILAGRLVGIESDDGIVDLDKNSQNLYGSDDSINIFKFNNIVSYIKI